MTLAFLLTTQNKSLATNIPLVLIVKLSQWGQYLYEVKCFIHSRIETYHYHSVSDRVQKEPLQDRFTKFCTVCFFPV